MNANEWLFVFAIIGAIADVIAVLDYFSRKFKTRAEGESMPWSRKWRLILMLTLLVISLGLSGYGFYRTLNPTVVEKIIEKPVDRIVEKPVEKIVEKIVPAKCPKAAECPKAQLVIPPNTTIEATTNAPDSMAAGINTGTMIKGDAPPQMTLTKLGANVPDGGRFKTEFRMQVVTQRAFVLYLKATSPSLVGGIIWNRDVGDPRRAGPPMPAPF